ncbi:MAG: AAA family ATPase, partial [Deltaproteobacteria bacterium]|nr:AAA family ATPase [Deltaproteobacteria bacterium]
MNDFNRIPLGIADFAEIRSEGFIYADKTELIYKLIESKQPFFLSRPRRFGKSLLVSTLETLLKGGEDNKKLFEGLWIGD